MNLLAFNAPLGEWRLLPDRRGRPTPWVIAIMMFVTLVVAAAGLAVANAVRVMGEGVANRYSLQLVGGGPDRTAAAVAALREVPDVAAVQPVPEAEVRQTLQSWLGPDAAASAELPVPLLIDVDLKPGSDPVKVRAALGRAVPGASVLAYTERLGPVLDSLRALGWLALALVLLMGLAMAAAVVLATRGAFDTHRSTIEIMHGIGATDEQLARLFQRRIAFDALAGGLAGAAAAVLVLLLLFAVPGELLGTLSGRPVLRLADWLLLAMLPLAAALGATLVARTTVLKALRATL